MVAQQLVIRFDSANGGMNACTGVSAILLSSTSAGTAGFRVGLQH